MSWLGDALKWAAVAVTSAFTGGATGAAAAFGETVMATAGKQALGAAVEATTSSITKNLAESVAKYAVNTATNAAENKVIDMTTQGNDALNNAAHTTTGVVKNITSASNWKDAIVTHSEPVAEGSNKDLAVKTSAFGKAWENFTKPFVNNYTVFDATTNTAFKQPVMKTGTRVALGAANIALSFIKGNLGNDERAINNTLNTMENIFRTGNQTIVYSSRYGKSAMEAKEAKAVDRIRNEESKVSRDRAIA